MGAEIPVPKSRAEKLASLLTGFEHLAPRNVPTQKRAMQTVDRILDSAASLVDEVGLDAFNTNLLAERAGVRIRTVYRYFPNKEAVLAALIVRFHVEIDDSLGPTHSFGDPAQDWRAVVDGWVEGLMSWAEQTPGSLLFTGRLQGFPELLELRDRLDRFEAEELAAAMQSRGASISERQLHVVARTYIDVSDAVTALAATKRSDHSDEVIGELKVLLKSYLANYLD